MASLQSFEKAGHRALHAAQTCSATELCIQSCPQLTPPQRWRGGVGGTRSFLEPEQSTPFLGPPSSQAPPPLHPHRIPSSCLPLPRPRQATLYSSSVLGGPRAIWREIFESPFLRHAATPKSCELIRRARSFRVPPVARSSSRVSRRVGSAISRRIFWWFQLWNPLRKSAHDGGRAEQPFGGDGGAAAGGDGERRRRRSKGNRDARSHGNHRGTQHERGTRGEESRTREERRRERRRERREHRENGEVAMRERGRVWEKERGERDMGGGRARGRCRTGKGRGEENGPAMRGR